ncbi:MAG: hypothetical protein HKM00_00055 [Gallionella sp.]|jgi:hypothetical protein|nr:hypothetical protein [Gallionella sp.]
MKNRIAVLWLRVRVLASETRQRIDAFVKNEDELYWADPAAYRRRTDSFWAKVALVLWLVMMLTVYILEA